MKKKILKKKTPAKPSKVKESNFEG
jgi:hypothetical protein